MSATEFSIISRYFSSLGRGEAVDLGVGDDCAILRLPQGQRLATSKARVDIVPVQNLRFSQPPAEIDDATVNL